MRKLFALLLLAAGVASAANPAYMTIAGIEGSVPQESKKGTVMVLEFSQTVESPLDPVQMTPTGRARHGLVTFHKDMDKASPQLLSRALTQAIIPSITIRWYQIRWDGQEVVYLEQKYTNVRIVKFRPYLRNGNDAKSTQNFDHLEEVTFSYRAMSTTFLDGNLIAGGTSSVAW